MPESTFSKFILAIVITGSLGDTFTSVGVWVAVCSQKLYAKLMQQVS